MNWGGGEKQILYLITELKKKSVEQTLVCPKNSILSEKAKDAGCTVIELKKTPFLVYTWSLKIHKLVNNGQNSILHAHDGKAHSCVLVHALSHPKTPIVLHRRLVKIEDNFYHRWKFNHPSIQKIICISSAVQSILEHIVSDKAKLVLIPSGIKIDHKTRSAESKEKIRLKIGIPKQAQLLLNIGSLLPQKQQIFFLKIAKTYFEKFPNKKDSVYFAIMGEGPLKSALSVYISENGLAKNCILLGFIKNSQEILACSDLLLCTAVDEALGNVVLEAFLMGVPVIASKSGGFPDLITDQETGFLAEPLNEEDFLRSCELRAGKHALPDASK
jgi:glycosyltransferase involved in cell wall biosynthesis